MAGTEQGPHLRPPFPKPPWYLGRPGTGKNPGAQNTLVLMPARSSRRNKARNLPGACRLPWAQQELHPNLVPNGVADRRPGLAFFFGPKWCGRSPARAGFCFRAQMVWQIVRPGWLFFSGPKGVADRRPGLAFFSAPNCVADRWPGRAFFLDPNGVSRPDGRHVQTKIEFRFSGPTSCGRIDRNSKWLLFSDPNGGARGGVNLGWLFFRTQMEWRDIENANAFVQKRSWDSKHDNTFVQDKSGESKTQTQLCMYE